MILTRLLSILAAPSLFPFVSFVSFVVPHAFSGLNQRLRTVKEVLLICSHLQQFSKK